MNTYSDNLLLRLLVVVRHRDGLFGVLQNHVQVLVVRLVGVRGWDVWNVCAVCAVVYVRVVRAKCVDACVLRARTRGGGWVRRGGGRMGRGGAILNVPNTRGDRGETDRNWCVCMAGARLGLGADSYDAQDEMSTRCPLHPVWRDGRIGPLTCSLPRNSRSPRHFTYILSSIDSRTKSRGSVTESAIAPRTVCLCGGGNRARRGG